jgi:2,3-bisphosphoglycerate-dependent phosphoglycerate mutase
MGEYAKLRKNPMSKLIIVRHHESDWNKLGLWTGKRDRHLTEYGFRKSEDMGRLLAAAPGQEAIRIDRAYASMQVRSIETLSSMLEVLDLCDIPTTHSSALNERDYGDYTGRNKWEMEKMLGDENWNKVRREWDFPVPNGETLRMVYDRVVPFFKNEVLPYLRKGEHVLIVSHGNAIRALMKYIEDISGEKIKDLEMLFGKAIIYELDADGRMISKEVRQTESSVNA